MTFHVTPSPRQVFATEEDAARAIEIACPAGYIYEIAQRNFTSGECVIRVSTHDDRFVGYAHCPELDRGEVPFYKGQRLRIYPSSDKTYTSDVTVKFVDTHGDVVVIYDKPISGVRPTQTFRPGVLRERIV